MWFRRFFCLTSIALLFSCATLAQQSPPTTEKVVVDNAFLQQQFGDEFKVLPGFAPMVADFDGDGIEDVAIAATSKNPLLEAGEHNFKVLDPYYGFFGVSDPKITTTFASTDPKTTSYVLVIIHGSGSEAWRAEKPKAKFVIINIPFKEVAVKHLQVRKKLLPAIFSVENGGDEMTSALYFDGHKYKYEPLGAALH
jgi:hypothetical protein